MLRIETREILIELPADWNVFVDQGTFVVHGPNNTEVIATVTALSGHGSEAERIESLTIAERKIIELMRRNASRSELTTTADVAEKVLTNGVKLAHLSSIAIEAAIVFDQFMLCSEREVLFLTYEGPASAEKTRDLILTAITSASRR